MQRQITLTPAQRTAAEGLREALKTGRVLILRGAPGAGKTTVLEWLHAASGGGLLCAAQFMQSVSEGSPHAIEESFLRMIEEAMEKHDLLLVDDLHLVTNVVQRHWYPRSHLLDAALTALLAEAAVRKKTLVFAVEEEAPFPVQLRASVWEIGDSPPSTTGADLQAVVDDAKLLFAHDVSTGTPPRPAASWCTHSCVPHRDSCRCSPPTQ